MKRDTINYMRIGILTLSLHTNYGGILQNYALQQMLQSMGYDSCTIRRECRLGKKRRILNFFIAIVRFLLRKKKETNLIGMYTDEFINNYITATQKIYTTRKLKKNAAQFDALIVGSDQVWRPKYSPCITNYFFDFIDKSSTLKCLVYGASFGVDHWEYNKKQSRKCISLCSQIEHISVREDSAVSLCQQYFGKTPIHVLDPTLLLDKKEYISLVNKEGIACSNGNLMVYILDEDSAKSQIVDYVASSLGLIPFSTMPHGKSQAECIEQRIYPPVTHWLRGFMDAEFIVTDSYHGIVFSIIFNKPFIAIGNESRGLTRFTSLLKLVGLSNRLIFRKDQLSDSLLIDPINYTLVNAILQKEKEKSVNYISCSLK